MAEINEVRTIRDLRELLSGGNKWTLLSTGGYHGTTLTLDDIEQIIRGEHKMTEAVNNRYWITILVVDPAKVEALSFGELLVSLDDVQWLREEVRKTLKAIKKSQEGNF